VVARLPLEAPVRVPAGAAVVVVRAPGHVAAQSNATLPAGASTEMRIDLAPAPPPPPFVPLPPVEPPPEPPPSWDPWIYGTAAIGGVGLSIGIGLGVLTLVKKGDRDEICPDPTCDKVEGVELDQDARQAGLGSTVAFVIGGAGVVTAIFLAIFEPSDDTVQPSAGGLRVAF
jgi:hypothetical protein